MPQYDKDCERAVAARKLLLEIYKRTSFPSYLGLGFKVVHRGV